MRLRLTVLALVCASWLSAQQAPVFPRLSYFRKMFSTPTGRVELQPPVRLSDFVADGKLELSLRAYLDLVMANNTDIAVQRLSVETSRNNVMGAFGTFDPTLSASFGNTRSASPQEQKIDAASVLKTLNQPASVTYNQTLFSGTQFNVGFTGSKFVTNSANASINPNMKAGFSFGFAQPLLRGRGAFITRMPITIARANLRSSQLNLTDQIMSLIQSAESAYWDVVGARESLKVRQQSLALSAESLKLAQRELDLGARPPLDIFQPRADYATAQITVSQAQFRLAQVEDALRKQLGADLDPKFRNMPIVLTETVLPPDEATVLDREALVEQARRNRPDLGASRIGLEIDDLNIRQTADRLRPNLSLGGNYSSSGASRLINGAPSGLWDAYSQVFGFNTATYSLTLNLTLPLRDRAGAARLANNLVTKKQDALNLRSREQAVRLSVLNAISQVESSRESVKLALIARDLAQQQLDAEKKKYDLGTEMFYFVLDAQTRLTNAESSVVNESINYRENQLNLLRGIGTLLEERGIVIQ
jgi:outer membrane protein